MNICFNGNFYDENEPVLTAANRSFKWGDGVFETMKFFNGKLLLSDLHFERLAISLQLLQIERPAEFTLHYMQSQVQELCSQNSCLSSARIRLAAYREDGNKMGYVIEATPLQKEVNNWQQQGLEIVLYPYARKSMDAFANLKSANFLPYVLAADYAKEKGADDAIVLNAAARICDSSKANVFLIKNGEVFTPALYEGCINGVMRRLVIQTTKSLGYVIHQQEITEELLTEADEVFLTNAIQIIRWVKAYRNSHYQFEITKKIFNAVQATIFSDFC